MGDIGTILQDKGNLNGALGKYNEGLIFCKEIGNKEGIAAFIHNIGTIYYEKKDYISSLRNLFESATLKEQMGIPGHETTEYIFKIRKALGLSEFKKLAKQVFDSLPDELKSFVNLEEFTKDETVHYEASKVGRNDPCPCGSGKKYKKCHGN